MNQPRPTRKPHSPRTGNSLKLWIPTLLLVIFPVMISLQNIHSFFSFPTPAKSSLNNNETIEWFHPCETQRVTVSGIGMGDRDNTFNPQTLVVGNTADTTQLRAQVAGRLFAGSPLPDSVTFDTGQSQPVTLNQANQESADAYNFTTVLPPAEQVTATIANIGSSHKRTPRGLILYNWQNTPDKWTSTGRIVNAYIYDGGDNAMHSEVLTFPPLAEATDLHITALVIDNNDDDRPVIAEATAGGVSESISRQSSDHGPLLNIFRLTLPQVPAGTSQAIISLRVLVENSDSAILSGVNLTYNCPEPPQATIQIEPSPASIPLGTSAQLTITVHPNAAQVNGVQIHGSVDPTYLLIENIDPTGALPVTLDPPYIDTVSGEFRYGAGTVGSAFTTPFAVATLRVRALAPTPEGGTQIRLTHQSPPPTDISGPDGSVLEEAIDGAVFVTSSAVLQGRVEMQGRDMPPPHSSWAIPLSVWLTPTAVTTNVHQFDVTTNDMGEFTIDSADILAGQYDIGIKGNHTLRNRDTDLTLSIGDNSYSFGTLKEGDVETDTTFNQVFLADYGILVGSLNKCAPNPTFVANADLNEDGCVVLADFGLLSSNYGKHGDQIITAEPDNNRPVQNISADENQALLFFSDEELVAPVNETITLAISVDPREHAVNGAMLHLGFDPDFVEIKAITPTDNLPIPLVNPLIDNQEGTIQFAAGIIGRTITEPFTLATLSLQVTTVTSGTSIIPVDAFPATALSGPQGNIPTEIRSITLSTQLWQSENKEMIYIPVIVYPK